LLEAVLAAVRIAQRRLVPLQEKEDLAAVEQDRYVAVEDLVTGTRGTRLVPSPGDKRVKSAEMVLGKTPNDVFFRLEVIIKGRFGDPEALGDFAQ
jgi:hypothetical protein